MTLFWHTYVLSYIGTGLIVLLLVIQYTRFCNDNMLNEDEAIMMAIACILLWPIFLGAITYSFYKSHLLHIMIVNLKDIPHAWKAAVINERNRNTGDGNGIESVDSVKTDEIMDLRIKIRALERINTETSRELTNIKESVPGSGQQRSMKRLANIIRT